MLGNVGVTFVVLLAVFIIGWETGKTMEARKFSKMVSDTIDHLKQQAEDARAHQEEIEKQMAEDKARRNDLFMRLIQSYKATKDGDTDGDIEQNSEDS